MNALNLFHRIFRRDQSGTQKSRRQPKSIGRRYQLEFEGLEDRCVPSSTGVSTITSNFNGTAIAANDTLWFSSVFKPSGIGSDPVTIRVTGQQITSPGLPTINVPDSLITLSAGTTATTATTSFDAQNNTWVTNLPLKFSGNGFLGGVAVPAAAAPPGGTKSISWTATFTTDTPGVSLNWQWATAVYKTSFDNSVVAVKPLDVSTAQYPNSDHAGTPENFKTFVTGGARGGGGSNFTGSYSATGKVTFSETTCKFSIAGSVDDSGGIGFANMVVTLTGGIVPLMTTVDANGNFSFSDLDESNYTITLYDGSLSVLDQQTILLSQETCGGTVNVRFQTGSSS